MNLRTAHQTWNKLEVTYEGIPRLKEAKINLLMHDYELSRMNLKQTIKAIGVTKLGKVFSNAECKEDSPNNFTKGLYRRCKGKGCLIRSLPIFAN